MYNFSEYKTIVARLAQRSGDADYLTNIGDWVNLSVKFLADIYDYYQELEGIYNFTTVDGTEDYGMPNDFDKPLRIFDLTNKKDLTIITEEKYYDQALSNIADSTESNTPEFARLYGVRGVKTNVGSAGSKVKAKSSAAESSSVTVRVEGYIDSSKTILAFEDLTVTGTSYTSLTTATFYEITRVSKSADSTGYITLADSSENTLTILTSIDRVIQHPVLRLGKIPGQANSMRILYKKKIRKMVDNNDYPFVDADEFIVTNSLGFAYSQEKETESRATVMWGKADAALKNMLRNKQGRLGPDYQHKITSGLIQAHRA